ncbi:hypothetical protein D3C71_1854980 [compost metagenome]
MKLPRFVQLAGLPQTDAAAWGRQAVLRHNGTQMLFVTELVFVGSLILPFR